MAKLSHRNFIDLLAAVILAGAIGLFIGFELSKPLALDPVTLLKKRQETPTIKRRPVKSLVSTSDAQTKAQAAVNKKFTSTIKTPPPPSKDIQEDNV